MTLVLDRLAVAAQGRAPLFPPLSLTVAPGTVTSVMGPSGIGKSTLLDAIGGHLARDWEVSGRVLLNGRDVTRLAPEARGIGVLFQEALLFPHLSVGDNLAFGLGARLRGRAARRAAVEEALAQAGLAGFHDRDPATLSGGQKARAALLRTLLAEPQALLLDEPFSRLDAGLRDDIRQFVFARVAERGIPALLVTHDEADAGAAGGPVLALSADT
jgi:putative thiamine transport system ATP-binding protein